MKITINRILTDDVMGHNNVVVHFWDPLGPPHCSADVVVFVKASDSIEELKQRAMVAARQMLERMLAAPAVESRD